jgi:hypothetical protein
MSNAIHWNQFAHFGKIGARADRSGTQSKVKRRVAIRLVSRDGDSGEIETILEADMAHWMFWLVLIPGAILFLIVAISANLWYAFEILTNARYRAAKRRIAKHGDYVSRLTGDDIKRLKKKTEGLPLGL